MITAVVVPIHDEEALLPSCLAALAAAGPDLVVLVADACRDASVAIASAWCRGRDAWVLRAAAKNVGIARALGMSAAIMRAGCDPDELWLASTDADSRVPPGWLRGQLACDADAYAGTIEVEDWAEHDLRLVDRFRRFYRSHTHVHGANLGVRASAYLEAGGFPPLATGEDHALWRELAGHRRVFSRANPVITSARRTGRAPHGFAGFLAAMG